MGYVPMLAELLSDFTPETVCGVIIAAKQRAPHLMHDWLCSILYLIAKCDGVERRDASRLLVLLVLMPLDTTGIIQNFRTLVMAPSRASETPLQVVESAVRDEFYRLNPDLADAFKHQPPITPGESVRAMNEIVDRLIGPPPPPNPNSPVR